MGIAQKIAESRTECRLNRPHTMLLPATETYERAKRAVNLAWEKRENRRMDPTAQGDRIGTGLK